MPSSREGTTRRAEERRGRSWLGDAHVPPGHEDGGIPRRRRLGIGRFVRGPATSASADCNGRAGRENLGDGLSRAREFLLCEDATDEARRAGGIENGVNARDAADVGADMQREREGKHPRRHWFAIVAPWGGAQGAGGVSSSAAFSCSVAMVERSDNQRSKILET